MITLIEALNYRCLRYIYQPLDRFHVLVGPNASGKTTFLDVIAFLGRLLTDGLENAIRERTPNPQDLLFGRQGNRFELAIEAAIPFERFDRLPQNFEFDRIRYEIAIGIDPERAEASIHSEILRLKQASPNATFQAAGFPETITLPLRHRGSQTIVRKGEKDHFYSEIKHGRGRRLPPLFQLGPKRSAFASLPEDESQFPVAIWFKEMMAQTVQQIVLNSQLMRLASPPGMKQAFQTDGSNLPWVIADLQRYHEDQFRDWIAHLQTALPDLAGIRTVEREDDRHRYTVVQYQHDLDVPSWLSSDGTLRLLALTLPAYLPHLEGVLLIEEPENGLHPRALETIFQSLSNVYHAQVLLATHSPLILSAVEPEQVLCFVKNSAGATEIVRGDRHPSLLDWQRDPSLGTLFAAGVLG